MKKITESSHLSSSSSKWTKVQEFPLGQKALVPESLHIDMLYFTWVGVLPAVGGIAWPAGYLDCTFFNFIIKRCYLRRRAGMWDPIVYLTRLPIAFSLSARKLITFPKVVENYHFFTVKFLNIKPQIAIYIR